MPWFLFALVLVPTALLEGSTLGFLSLAACILLSLGFILLSRGGAWLVLAFSGLVMSILGLLLGGQAHSKYMEDYMLYKKSPAYHNVLPTEDPGAFKDGAFLEFTRTTRVDTTRGLGYKDGKLWCVAPVVDGARYNVGFWAVGTDCCRARGWFSCGDVGDPSQHAGLVVLDTSHFTSPDIAFFKTAARMASQTYGLEIPDDATFVRWGVSPEQVLHNKLGTALVFSLLALLGGFAIVPCLLAVLHLRDLSLTKGQPALVKQMVFGFELTPREYDRRFQLDLLNHRCHWSGEVIYDYAFHLANKHLYIGPFLCHPAHPLAKWERGIILTVNALLIVFPVSAFSVKFGQEGMMRTVVVLVAATIPRNILKLYLMNLTTLDSQIELEGGTDGRSKEKIRRAQRYEFIFLAGCVVVTTAVVIFCVAFIKSHSGKPVGSVLLRNCDGLSFAFILEILFDLCIPFWGDAEYKSQVTLGFFGRWVWERDDFAAAQALESGGPAKRQRTTQMKRLPPEQGSAGALLSQPQPSPY